MKGPNGGYVLTVAQQRIVSKPIAAEKNPVEKSVQLKKKEKKHQKKKEKKPVENWKAAKSAPSHFPTGPTTGGYLLIIKKSVNDVVRSKCQRCRGVFTV